MAKMDARGVLVSCTPIGSKEGGVCSGILFAENWILTLGTILDSVFQDGNKNHQCFEDYTTKYLRPLQLVIVPFSFKKSLPKFTILMDDAKSPQTPAISLHNTNSMKVPYTFGIIDADGNQHHAENRELVVSEASQSGVHPSATSSRRRRAARLTAMWRCPLVSEATSVVLGGWQLSPTDPKEREQTAFKTLLSTFVLLHIDDDQQVPKNFSNKDVMDVLGQLMRQLKAPERGEEVVIESTIFGREFFFNSWSQGIISNVLGNRGSLLLTDARAGLGCEGGPIFTRPEWCCKRRLVGMVLSPVSWWKGEWVGFTIGVALQPMLAYVQGGPTRSGLPTKYLGILNKSALSRYGVDRRMVDSSVVLVRSGSAWGSGVVVDSKLGFILTCSHVVRKSEPDTGLSVWWHGATLPATLVYRTRSDVAYDLALLRVAPHAQMQQIAMSRVAAVKGEAVFAVGFPMFSERENRSVVPIVTRGIVAHVATPMVQTTCCVQSGASGGPVLRANGEMVGVVSCNANDLETGALFPHVNMAIPTTAFAVHIQRYIDTFDLEALRPLEEKDETIQEMWKLKFTPSKL